MSRTITTIFKKAIEKVKEIDNSISNLERKVLRTERNPDDIVDDFVCSTAQRGGEYITDKYKKTKKKRKTRREWSAVKYASDSDREYAERQAIYTGILSDINNKKERMV